MAEYLSRGPVAHAGKEGPLTLDDLRRAAELLPPGASLTLPREALLTALSVETRPETPAESPQTEAGDAEKWLTADECADLLHVSARWCYDHGQQLGVRRLSRRCVRFSSRAVARYMARR
jgi:hypothetical protein